MGHLSQIFRGVLNQQFSLTQHMASTAIRLMSTKAVYEDLADTEDGISLESMTNKIVSPLKHFDLNDQEVFAFILFSFMVALDVRGRKYVKHIHDKSNVHWMWSASGENTDDRSSVAI